MRIWFLPFEEISDQHILGQHKELGLMNSMLESPRSANHPLTRYFADKKNWLGEFHDRLVEEMDYRFDHYRRNGHVHKTPVPESHWGDGIEHLAVERYLILYDMIDISARYQQSDEFRPGWYRWGRPRPEWTKDPLARRIELNKQPLHQIGWYGIENLKPFADNAASRKLLAKWEAKYGWLIDAWLELDVFNWPYFGTQTTPQWRQS